MHGPSASIISNPKFCLIEERLANDNLHLESSQGLSLTITNSANKFSRGKLNQPILPVANIEFKMPCVNKIYFHLVPLFLKSIHLPPGQIKNFV
jgi:hypothetical protein